MSLVGTRPPTLDEWEKYELHHRARLIEFVDGKSTTSIIKKIKDQDRCLNK